MEHVKQGLGFVMLIAVLWYLCSIKPEYRIATLFAAIGVAFGCWIVGKVPPYAESSSKLKAWAGALASIGLSAYLAFTYLGPVEHELLPWKPYSPESLAKAREEGKTVMIDFTAVWCVNCQVNYRFAINTPAVQEAVEKNGVVTLLADWSDNNDMIKQKIQELNSDSIPLLVVYPGDGGPPIVLRDLVLKSQVVKAIEDAGPSREEPKETVASKD